MYQGIIFILLTIISGLVSYIVYKSKVIFVSTTTIGKLTVYTKNDEDILIGHPEVLSSLEKYIDSKMQSNIALQQSVYMDSNGSEVVKDISKVYMEKGQMNMLIEIRRQISHLKERSNKKRDEQYSEQK